MDSSVLHVASANVKMPEQPNAVAYRGNTVYARHVMRMSSAHTPVTLTSAINPAWHAVFVCAELFTRSGSLVRVFQ